MTKLALRKAWFQAHKWIGLLLAVLIIPISLTGSALVWHDGLERMLHPDRYAVTGTATLPLATYVDAARMALAPGERIARIELPERSGEPVVVSAARPGEAKGRPVRTMLYLDPADARVIESSASNAGLVSVFHRLHGSLLVPGVGRQIVGWIGVAMLVSALSGLWLWWPTVGSWVRGLRWRRHRNLDTNLHHLLGFWIALPLAVLSFTGVWISFPQWFAGFEAKAPERPRGPAGPDRAAMMRAKPLATTATPLDRALSQAAAATPGTVRSVTWPTDLKPEWAVAVAGGEGGRPTSVAVADATAVATAEPQRGDEPETTARFMRRLHDGTDMGIVWQVIVFLGGILPAILAVTGIIMWWRAQGWRGDLKRRQRARRLQPAE